MRRQTFRLVAPMLCMLVAAAIPASAGTIEFAQVAGALGGRQARSASELRLRVAAQSGRTAGQTSAAPGTAVSSEQQQQQQSSDQNAPEAAPDTTSAAGLPDSTLTQSGGQIETVDLGDVTGTVCDCGEIPRVIPRGGLPWWPLLFTPPLICLTGICTPPDDEPECIVNCGPCVVNCGGEVIPEPTTLLLFGSGLLAVGASARRRFGRRQQLKTTATAEEV